MQLQDFFEKNIVPGSGTGSKITLVNRLFRVTVLSGVLKVNDETSDLQSESGYPFCWRRDETAVFRFASEGMAPAVSDCLQVRLQTAELGLITIGAASESSVLKALDRPRPFFDFLRKDYEVNLLLDGDEAAPQRTQLGFGVNLAEIDADEERPIWLDSKQMTPAAGLAETLRRLNAETLRFNFEPGQSNTLTTAALELCRTAGAAPYFRIDAVRFSEADLDRLCGLLRTGMEQGDFQPAYLEIDVQGFFAQPEGCGAVEAASERIRSFSDRFRDAVAGGKTLIGGLDGVRALANDRMMLFYENLMAMAAHAVDFIGVSWLFPGPDGWATEASAVDSAAIFATGTERLKRLAAQLFADIPGPLAKPLVLTSWRYFRASDDPARYEIRPRQADGFYIVSVLNALSDDDRFRLQLMDLSALVRRTDTGAIAEGIGAMSLRLTAERFETRIAWRVVRDEPLPGARSEGIPGLVDALDAADVAMSATRSRDRKHVTLIVQNRHPKKRLYARVHFARLPDLRPVRARIIRAGDSNPIRRFFAQNAAAPIFKELDLPRYRLMDHVNLDIPPQSMASMELRADSQSS